MKRFLFFVLAIIYSINLFAQAGAVDLTFNGDVLKYGIGPNDEVLAIAPLPDGKVILGGYFTAYNESPAPGIVRLNQDGTIDPTFDVGTGLSGTTWNVVSKILVRPDSKIMIAGNFQAYNGIPRNNIALLNPDGTLDNSFDPRASTNFSINEMAIQKDGKIIILGYFSEYDGNPARGIARINPDGSFDDSFQIPDTGRGNQNLPFTGGISLVNIQDDDKILISGWFSQINAETRNGIARLNPDGSLDTDFEADLGVGSEIRACQIQKDGKILIGGYKFSNKDGQVINNLVRLNPKGTFDIGFEIQEERTDIYITNLKIDNNGNILVGLGIPIYEYEDDDDTGSWSTNAIKLERLNDDGSRDLTFNSFSHFSGGADGGDFIFTIETAVDNTIFLGILIWGFPNQSMNYFVAFDENGSLSEEFNPYPGFNGLARTILLDQEGKILVDGNFSIYRGTSVRGLARLLPDGNIDKDFYYDPEISMSFLNCMALQDDGKILVGGRFSDYNVNPYKGIIRLNQDGSIDNSFIPGFINFHFLPSVSTIAVQSDGKILVGGNFTSFNGLPIRSLVRLNQDGSIDHSFNLDPRYTSSVQKILIQEDGNILIGGRLARLYPDGSLDESFNPLAELSLALIGGMEIQADGKIVAFGTFRSDNLPTDYRIARFNQNGSLDHSFTPIAQNNQLSIWSLAIQSDGKILVAKNGAGAIGIQKNLIRLNSDGSEDLSFDVSFPSIFTRVNSIALQKDNKILIGGDFTKVNDIDRFRIARLLNEIEETCNIEIKAKDEVLLSLDKNGKARLTPQMVDLGSCSTCGPVKLTLDKCDFTCDDIGLQMVKFTVTDKEGNTRTKEIEVTVKDEMKPTVGIGQQSFVWMMQSGDTFTLPDFRPFIGAEDNCSFEIKQTPAPGTQFKKPTTTTICFDAVDKSGNKTTANIGFSLIVFGCIDSGKNGRISEEVSSGIISTPWNSSLEQAIKQGVRFEAGSDPEIIKRIVWTSNGYNRFAPGNYPLNVTIKNNFVEDMNPSIDLTLRVENKPLAEDITINNNTVPRNVRKSEIIGKLETVDRADHIHTYSMDPHPDFYIEKDVLVWKGDVFPDFESKLMIHSHDRAGQTISREIVLQRKLSMINEVLIYPNPTMDHLNLEFKLLEKTNFWLRIFDVQGKLVLELYFENKTSFYEKFDVHKYSPGIYTIQVNYGFSIKSYKFIKK